MDKRKHTTLSGIELKASYGPEDIGLDRNVAAEAPGTYPFTRGITPEMYREQLWVMGQYSGFASAEEANQRYRYLIEKGQTGFSIALDLPTQMGLDSDHPMAEGEVGRCGVAIDSLKDMEILLEGIPFEKVRQMRTTANAIAPIILAMIVAFAEKKGVDPNGINVLLQNDILKEYFCRGTFIFPPGPSVKLAVDVVEYCAKHLNRWTPMAICGYHIRDAGATAVQELAFTLADAIAYLDAAVKRGVEIDLFAPRLYQFLGAHIDLLEEVAKFRAARRLWAKLMKERYGARKPESLALRIFAYTLGGALTAEQPLNNIVRVTIETLGAVLGGVQTLATSSYDEALSIPTEEAVTVSLRTQQIVAYESGVTGTADPLGGSYAIEYLTNEIERQVNEYLQKIEAYGGAVPCIEKGFFQKELADSAYRFQRMIDSGERVIVGVNRFRDEARSKIPVFKVDPESELRVVERTRKVRQTRNNAAVKRALDGVKRAAEGGDNVIPSIIAAVKEYATLGEICDTLKSVYGSYKPVNIC
ncbi:MAG TPA: methylmalonyl-CoA mutase [Firmicutes bacterium]|nr:methylmalonyl-CoA mutase [Bacillota bacterium]